MSNQAEQLLGQLHKVIAELEGLASTASDTAEAGAGQVAEQLRGALGKARSRIKEAEQVLERDLRQGGKVVDEYVKDNAWMSIGIAVAVGFLLGALTARRE